MKYKATILKPNVWMINIDTGFPSTLLMAEYNLEVVEHTGRTYAIIEGTRLGAITSNWLVLEKNGTIKLERLEGVTLDGIQLPITSRLQLTSEQIQNLRVGHLAKGRFVCNKCALKYNLDHPQGIAVYPINILPYSQSCWDCGLVVFQIAKSYKDGLLELFPKPESK